MLLALELAYRGQASLRNMLRAEAPTVQPGHPYESEVWWSEWLDGAGEWRNRYDPYRGIWALPRTGAYLNIDTLGRRLTVQPALDRGTVRRTVYLFGGSTMFGYTARDGQTIASHMADLLAEAGATDVEVVNLAQSAFNVTQGLNTLTLELRAGRVPDVVAFLDGNNEVAPAFQSGRPGSVLNEDVIAQEVGSPPPSLLRQVASSFAFVDRLGRFLGLGVTATRELVAPNAADICPGVAETYLGATSVVEALGATFGFDALFFWQPMLATTGKDLTSYEMSARADAPWGETVRACTLEVARTAERRRVPSHVSLTGLFDDDSGTVYVDDYGHVTETANRRIAEAMLERIMPLVGELP
jgi:lysophospholipase L1-like esterase